jgi:hypothetical protein
MSNRLLHKSVIHEDATPSTRWIDGSNTTTNIIAAIILVLAAFLPVGGLYWVWIAGVYMLLVGVPSWVVMVFG